MFGDDADEQRQRVVQPRGVADEHAGELAARLEAARGDSARRARTTPTDGSSRGTLKPVSPRQPLTPTVSPGTRVNSTRPVSATLRTLASLPF